MLLRYGTNYTRSKISSRQNQFGFPLGTQNGQVASEGLKMTSSGFKIGLRECEKQDPVQTNYNLFHTTLQDSMQARLFVRSDSITLSLPLELVQHEQADPFESLGSLLDSVV